MHWHTTATPKRIAALAAALAATHTLACGDDATPPANDGGETDAGAHTAPNIPWLETGAPDIAAPTLTPCPPGWREVPSATKPPTCDAFPEEGPTDCPTGEAHFPGEPGCAPVGSPCPPGAFSETLPVDRTVVYVQPGGTGDGSTPTTPYDSLMRFSLATLPTNTVIALSRGSHLGPARVTRSHVLQGACAAETILSTTDPSDAGAVVTIRDAGGEVRDLTIASSPRAGIEIFGESAQAVLAGVAIDDTERVGLEAAHTADVVAEGLLVRNTRGRASDGTLGRGIVLELGRTARMSRVAIEHNRDVGVFAGSAGTTLALTDVVVRGTQGRTSDAGDGSGLVVQSGASLEATRTHVVENHNTGLFAHGAGTTASLSDVLVRDTRSETSSATRGRGISVDEQATVVASRLLLDRNRTSGLLSTGTDTTVALTDAVVRDTQSQELDRAFGRGVAAQNGATAALVRVVLERNHDIGVSSSGTGASVSLDDVVVRDTSARELDGRFGRALDSESGATATATRVLFERNREVGVVANDTASVTLADAVVRDTASRSSDGGFGRALGVQDGGTAQVMRALFEGNREVSVDASGAGVDVSLTDVVVRDTRGRESDDEFGRAVGVELGATVNMTRVTLEQNREIAMFVAGPGANATAVDLLVQDSLARDCAATTCADAPAGHGVGSFDGAAVAISNFVVARSTLCGVFVANGGEMDLMAGEVRESSIGACLQQDGYDPARLTSGVRYIDNDTNLQATSLPVPEPVAVGLAP